MIRRPGLVVGAVLAATVLASCGWAGETAAPIPYPLDGLESACDEFGNRVYVRTKATQATLAVVGQDPTCAAVGSGLGNGGLESGGPSVDLEGAVTG